MRPSQSLSVIATILFTSALANAQCKDGICRIPSANSQSPSPFSNTSFRNPEYNRAYNFSNYQDARPASACTDGSCHLGFCPNGDCDKNGDTSRTHQQMENRRPTDNLTRRSNNYDGRSMMGDYPSGSLQAPRPVSQDYQAASYRPIISWIKNYEQGLEESRRTGRPMLIKVSADWCEYCQRMKRDTYSDQSVIHNINSSFVAVALDGDQDRRLIQQIGVRTLPSVVVITPNLKIVDRIEGYKTVRELNASLLRHTQRAELKTDLKVATR